MAKEVVQIENLDFLLFHLLDVVLEYYLAPDSTPNFSEPFL